jgi:hypothetical protein
MALEFTTSYLADSLAVFRQTKLLAEKAIAQVTDDQLLAVTDPEANSIALIVKHLAGNMRSRWIGFPQADGEKPDRRRDTEFEAPPQSRAALLALWEEGWSCVFAALAPLTDADLVHPTLIRGERHSIMQAINRQIAHYSYHCGQIVFLARQLRGPSWQSLSVPRGKSEEFSRRVASGEASQR